MMSGGAAIRVPRCPRCVPRCNHAGSRLGEHRIGQRNLRPAALAPDDEPLAADLFVSDLQVRFAALAAELHPRVTLPQLRRRTGNRRQRLRGGLRARGLRIAPSAPLAAPGNQRPRLLRAIARPIVMRAAEALRQHRLAAARLAADGARAGRTPAAPAAQASAEAAGEIGHGDGALQRALDALRDDLAQLGPNLLAEALYPFPHAGASASA